MALCKCGCGQDVKSKRNIRNTYVHGHHSRKPPIEGSCLECSAKFLASRSAPKPFSRKFCSLACYHAYKKKNDCSKWIEKKCDFCGKDMRVNIHILDTYGRGKFCSKKCSFQKKRHESVARQSSGNYRKNAWRTFEHKCCDCGYDKDLRCLVVHHIDDDRKNGRMDNLCIVCHNCHCIRHLNMGVKTTVPSFRTKNLLTYKEPML